MCLPVQSGQQHLNYLSQKQYLPPKDLNVNPFALNSLVTAEICVLVLLSWEASEIVLYLTLPLLF